MIAIGLLIAAYLALCIGLAVFGVLQPAAGVELTAQVVIVLGGGAANGRLLPVGRARVAAGVASLGAGQSLHMTCGLAGGGSEAALMAAEAVRLASMLRGSRRRGAAVPRSKTRCFQPASWEIVPW